MARFDFSKDDMTGLCAPELRLFRSWTRASSSACRSRPVPELTDGDRPRALMLITQALLAGVTNGFVYALVGSALPTFQGQVTSSTPCRRTAVVGAATAVFAATMWGMPLWLAVMTGCSRGWRPPSSWNSAPSALFCTAGAGGILPPAHGRLGFTFSAGVLYTVRAGGASAAPAGDEVTRSSARSSGSMPLGDCHLARRFDPGVAAILPVTPIWALHDGRFHRSGWGVNDGIDVPRHADGHLRAGRPAGGASGPAGGSAHRRRLPDGAAPDPERLRGRHSRGLANPLGALVGGLVIGILEAMSIVFVSSGMKMRVALTQLIIIMIFVPDGILGRAGRKGG